jgi:bifunctional DNA-binding transcriptional regulator/antitoxin component of YhaV-PrlF toxin-antitoxin module
MAITMKRKISRRGEITLPAKIRRMDQVEPGEQFEIERIARGQYHLIRQQPRLNKGLVDWLLSCPVKGYFVPIKSKPTNTI